VQLWSEHIAQNGFQRGAIVVEVRRNDRDGSRCAGVGLLFKQTARPARGRLHLVAFGGAAGPGLHRGLCNARRFIALDADAARLQRADEHLLAWRRRNVVQPEPVRQAGRAVERATEAGVGQDLIERGRRQPRAS
jgi:hypothetical protein